jgi:hypothetical protein
LRLAEQEFPRPCPAGDEVERMPAEENGGSTIALPIGSGGEFEKLRGSSAGICSNQKPDALWKRDNLSSLHTYNFTQLLAA